MVLQVKLRQKPFPVLMLHSAKNTLQQFRHDMRGDMGLLFLCIILESFMVGMILTHIPLYLETNGASPRTIGWVVGASSISLIIGSRFVAPLSQIISLRNLLFITAVINIASLIALYYLPGTISWFIIRFIAGLMMATHWLGLETWVNSLANRQNRGRIMGLYVVANTIPFGTGAGLIAYIFDKGILPYVIMILLMILAMLPIIRMKSHHINGHHSSDPNEKTLGFTKLLWQNPITSLISVASGIMFGAAGMIAVQIIKLNFTPLDAGHLLTIYYYSPIFILPFLGYLSNRYSPEKIIAISGFLAALAAWPSFYSGYYPLMTLGIGIYGMCEVVIYSSLLAMVGHEFKGVQLVAVNGLVVAIYSGASMVATPAAGEMMERFGLLGLPLLMMSVGIIALSILLKSRQSV